MLYLDCCCGIAGDMFAGALMDLGAESDSIVDLLSNIADVDVTKVVKKGVSATRLRVSYPSDMEEYSSLVEKVKDLSLSLKAEAFALSVLENLAKAEAVAHDVALKDVHLHEAADSIVDAVAAALALEELNLLEASFYSSTVSVGYLAPATLEIMRVNSIPSRKVSGAEIVTPTGASILAALSPEYVGEQPFGGREGFGAGEKDFTYPNVLRVVLADG
ncbi:MAG: nickel insertion protein [Candidatus Altiarchaeota archaeon]